MRAIATIAVALLISAWTHGKNTPATWNPADKSAQIALSNGNLTATSTSGGTDVGVRTTKTFLNKTYLETSFPQFGSGVGVANSSMTLDGFFLGSTADGIGVGSDGRIFLNFIVVGTIATGASSDKLCIAIDPTGRLFWARLNGGNWNGDPTADPSSGVNGIDISSIAGIIYGMMTSPNSAVTANFGASAYAFIPPAGYGNL